MANKKVKTKSSKARRDDEVTDAMLNNSALSDDVSLHTTSSEQLNSVEIIESGAGATDSAYVEELRSPPMTSPGFSLPSPPLAACIGRKCKQVATIWRG